MRILVGLSGGVDSAVTAYLLKKEGYDVTAGFMVNYLDENNPNCPTREDIIIAKEVAEYLEIPFFTFDYRDEYEEKVLNYMYDGYQKGITPNPDIMCNSEVKFKAFLDEAMELGFDKIAMGHYARIKDGKLLKGVDNNKDQSYFLAGLSSEQLSKTLFPIGELEKPEVREIAREAGLPNAERKDSQGICFVGKVNMAEFLEKKIKPKKGIIKDTSGKILGEHKGVFYYTIGQRKGLDIGGQKEPIFVVKKDLEKNEIIVGTENNVELYSDILIMKNINFLSPLGGKYPKGDRGLVAKCKIRYRQADQDCIVSKISEDEYKIKFEEKQRAIAQGQICAIYLEDELVMSGIIQ
ncbi:MAG: tRNA 2-thiouridine(34) synthase MnmA [Candidatus Gracilibacteria bacterium]|nr:tRNA 2-thiouridine(34) synthase MnmA [Candidatus Gracilibacteria bacterium]MDQ7023260.1 tRNA 2-thiouridine(34) synthase MnmA [Candidatus Gracilibacteria bacterium]